MHEVYLKLTNNLLPEKGPPKQLAQDFKAAPKGDRSVHQNANQCPDVFIEKRIAMGGGGGCQLH